MPRNNNIIPNEIKMKLERVDSNIKKIERYVNGILIELKYQNSPKKKYFISDKILSILTLIIAFLSLLVAGFAMYSSNKLAINNSSLTFTYENIDIKSIIMEDNEFTFTTGHDIGAQGGIKIYINTKVTSGQIKSLYLIQKQNNEFRFTLLNSEGIQDKFSGIKKYNADIHIDMEKKIKYENINIGIAQLYILSEDLNGKINIDTIQIVGPIILDYNDENKHYTLYGTKREYTFRYLKNNKLITLYDKDDANEGWVNLSDKYLDVIEETNIKKIEEDITMIKEKYSKY